MSSDPLQQIESEGARLLGSSTAAPGDVSSSVTGPGAPAAGESPAPQVITAAELFKREAEEWAGLPYVFGSILAEALPELQSVYTDAACLAWGEKMVPVARHHGWTIGVTGMWLALIGASWALCKPTAQAIRKRVRDAEAKRGQTTPPKPGPSAPVTGTGTEGASGAGAQAAG